MSVWIAGLLLTLTCVLVIDVSGFIQEMEGAMGKWLGCRVRIPKPFSCSFCMGFWVNVLYSIICGHFSVGFIAYALGLSVLTPVIGQVVWSVRDFTGLFFTKLFDFLGTITTTIFNFWRYV